MSGTLRGLLISIYRTAHLTDCTNGGVSATADVAIVAGAWIPPVCESAGEPVLILTKGNLPGSVKLVPEELLGKRTMFGGNFGFTSDSRFSAAVALWTKAPFYGAVPIHDRVE
jgi:hypothetical protein